MRLQWFQPRGYRHFDVPVCRIFAEKTYDAEFIRVHSWSPLIRYLKRTKRYKPKLNRTEFKDRPIMYASHRDACILSRYADELNAVLETYYKASGLDKHVIAYRRLGKANYNFAADAWAGAVARAPCMALCFDISGFFDHLDHGQLKSRLKKILAVNELSDDWYSVYRAVTRHRWVEKDHLKRHPIFGLRLKGKGGLPIATIAEVREAEIPISENRNGYGIPQGTPISAVFANLYMVDFDREISDICSKMGALYQRYSDDILIVCAEGDKKAIVDAMQTALTAQKLEFSAGKTEEKYFQLGADDPFQYLGFYIAYKKIYLRSSSLGKQWKKLRRSIRRIEKVGQAEIAKGNAEKVYTKKLRRKFLPVGVRNFSSYARAAASSLESRQIKQQVRRLERAADQAIKKLNK